MVRKKSTFEHVGLLTLTTPSLMRGKCIQYIPRRPSNLNMTHVSVIITYMTLRRPTDPDYRRTVQSGLGNTTRAEERETRVSRNMWVGGLIYL